MALLINWFFTIFLSFFIYLKILRVESRGNRVVSTLLGVVISAALSAAIYFLQSPLPHLRFALVILSGGVLASKMADVKLNLAITGFALSVGISYGFGLLTFSIVYGIIWLIAEVESDVIGALLAPLLQFAMIKLLFSIRRMKKGMLFLKDEGAGFFGLIISAIIFTAIVLIPNEDIPYQVRLAVIGGAIVSSAGIIFWWRKGLTKMYKKKIQQRAVKELEAELAQRKESSKIMEELIHRDNKLLAALHESAGLSGKTTLQAQIKDLMQDRMATICKAQQTFKELPKTDDTLLDGVMRSMLARANEREIQFDFTLFDDIAKLLEIMTPIKLSTLLSDLLENAIIATSHSEYRRILVSFGYKDGCYELSVKDSGIPFEQNTLAKLGQERASTHLSEGGSGIGYMTIFEILHEHKTSLIITQYPPKKFRFAKTVTIRFDGKDEYIVHNEMALAKSLA